MKKCNIFGTFQHFKHFQTFSNIFKHFPTFSSIFQHFQLFQVNSFTMDTGQTPLDFESTTNFLQNNMQNLQQEIQTLSSYNNNTSEYVQTTMSSSLAPNTTFNPDAVHLNHHFSLLEILLIGVSSVSASLFTVLGNALVIIAFIINRQLRTINNYGRLDGNFEKKNQKFFYLKNHSPTRPPSHHKPSNRRFFRRPDLNEFFRRLHDTRRLVLGTGTMRLLVDTRLRGEQHQRNEFIDHLH